MIWLKPVFIKSVVGFRDLYELSTKKVLIQNL